MANYCRPIHKHTRVPLNDGIQKGSKSECDDQLVEISKVDI